MVGFSNLRSCCGCMLPNWLGKRDLFQTFDELNNSNNNLTNITQIKELLEENNKTNNLGDL